MKKIISGILTLALAVSMMTFSFTASANTITTPVIARYYLDDYLTADQKAQFTAASVKPAISSFTGLSTAGIGWKDGEGWSTSLSSAQLSSTNCILRMPGLTNDATGIYYAFNTSATNYYRRLANPIKTTLDGIYYASVTLANAQASKPSADEVQALFSLASASTDKVTTGIVWKSTESAPLAVVNTDNVSKTVQSKYAYDFLIKLVVDADGTDRMFVEIVEKGSGFTGNWNYEASIELGTDDIDVVHYKGAKFAVGYFKDVEIEAYTGDLLAKAQQADALALTANKDNFHTLPSQIDTLLPAGKHSNIVKTQIAANSPVKAYDYLEFNNVEDRTELKTDASLRNGGAGWKSSWTAANSYSDTAFTQGNRLVRVAADGKYFFNIAYQGAHLRRWFSDSINTSEDGRYLFDFTMKMNGNVKNSSGAYTQGEFAIGAGDSYSSANNKIFVGMQGYAEGSHPADSSLPEGMYPYIKVGSELKVGTKNVRADGGATYKYSVGVDTNAEGKEVIRLQVALYEENLTNSVCDLKIEEELGNINLSYIDLASYTMGIAWFADFVIYEKDNMFDVENATFWNGATQITTPATLADTLTVKTVADNTRENAETVVLYVAAYEGDSLVKVGIQKTPIAANTIAPATLTFTAPDGVNLKDCTFKVFTWNDSLSPLTAVNELK